MRNFNDLCRVKVLARGKAILEQKRQDLIKTTTNGQELLAGLWKLDENDILKTSIWEVMNLFGQHSFMGSDSPIAMNFELVADAAPPIIPELPAKKRGRPPGTTSKAVDPPDDFMKPPPTIELPKVALNGQDMRDYILYRSENGGWIHWAGASEPTGLVKWAENAKKQRFSCRIVSPDGIIVYPDFWAGSKFTPNSKRGVVPKPRSVPRGKRAKKLREQQGI